MLFLEKRELAAYTQPARLCELTPRAKGSSSQRKRFAHTTYTAREEEETREERD
jgi:hypothetical protein